MVNLVLYNVILKLLACQFYKILGYNVIYDFDYILCNKCMVTYEFDLTLIGNSLNLCDGTIR
jgi:hypothetical protein